MKQKEQLKQPFFVQFLESQNKSNESAAGSREGKDPIFTLKIFDELEQTQKFPSDRDEI